MRRGFVACGGRYTHWRAMGQGPVVVMLHESPRSSTSLIPLMEKLSSQFCCIALDTPGYGASDPLPQRFAPIEAFADETLKALTALNIQDFQLYGTHTGAAIACEVALKAPNRVTSLLLDGFAVFTEDEQAPLLEKYLIDQTPRWDGSHLMRIWSRIRDQALFFPFYDRSESARLSPPKNDLDFMLRSCLGFIESGDHYRDGYQAALTYDGKTRAQGLDMPCRVHAVKGDLIAAHLPRVAGAVETVEQVPLGPERWQEETRAWFGRHNAPEHSAKDLPQDSQRRFVTVGDHLVYAARGEGDGLVLNPAKPAPRLSGVYGPTGAPSKAAWYVDAPGFGTNAQAAFEMDGLRDALDTPLQDIPQLDPAMVALPKPDFDGAFLMSSWYHLRDSLLDESVAPLFENVREDRLLRALSAGQLALLYGLCGQPL